MPRIRTVKPEHWEDDNWNLVSLQAHLLFIGMKNFADDKGVIRANAILIKNKVFPTREDIRTSDVEKWLLELKENSFLIPLEFEKKGYYVLDFCNEKIDKPQPSILPKEAFENIESQIRDDSRAFSNVRAGEERKGEERSSSGEGEERASAYPPTLQEVIDFFKEKNFSLEIAKKAFQHYQSANWHDSKGNKVINWKQKMITVWMNGDEKQQKNSKNARQTTIPPSKKGFGKL